MRTSPFRTARTTRAYPAIDYRQIAEQGALCYVDGTYAPSRDGPSRILDAVVSYEDASGRVHASRFESVRCNIRPSTGTAPGAHIRIAAELKWDGRPIYDGIPMDDPERARAFESDPAYHAFRPTPSSLSIRPLTVR